MERLGLVGLANAGKSTLFNALTGAQTPVASHPFSTTATATAIAEVADGRLDRLGELSRSRRLVRAGFEVVDIAALAKGAGSGQGLGNRFLGSLREVDALIYVLRAFVDPTVPGSTAPADALATLEVELVLADLASAEARLERQRKAAKGQPSLGAEITALEGAAATLGAGTPLGRSDLSEEELRLLRPLDLLTAKPALTVVNIGEEDLGDNAAPAWSGLDGADLGGHPPAPSPLAVCAQLEAEAARLDEAGRSELLEGLGLGEGVLPRLSRAAYHLLGRRTFFTTGPKESRAWTFREGARAPECAGIIHSDLERGFIRAEVIEWSELASIGAWAKAKELGRIRVEGKDYEVVDGDVMEIRFNV